MSDYPYADRFAVNRSLPEQGTSREDVLAELRTMATEEDAFWETGKCSGTMYCGDHDHYHFMNEAFGLFAHVNVLQRDMCPSATKFEAEIIAMTLGLQSGDAAVGRRRRAVRPRHHRRDRQHPARRLGLPRARCRRARHHPAQRHQARDGAPRLRQGVPPLRGRVASGPGRPRHHPGRRGLGARPHGRPDGGADRVRLQLRLRHRRRHRRFVRASRSSAASASTSTAAWVGSSCPSAASWATTSPPSTTPCPGVTSMSADTHKYGYAFKGSSVLTFRSKALRNAQYFYLTDWSGGKYTSPGMEGSRSGGLIAATWAAMVQLGHEGYLGYAKQIFETSFAMQEAVSLASRAPARRPPDVPLLLHLRRLRHLPRQRLHADTRLALQRPAVPQRAAHGGNEAPDPAPGGQASSRPTWPTPSPTPRSTPATRRSRAPSTAAWPAA